MMFKLSGDFFNSLLVRQESGYTVKDADDGKHI